MNAAVDYLGTLPFTPDRFQREAAAAIDAGDSVVVTAPTGAGKTVIAEAAIAHALELGGRAFYTTPIKALSNQKFADLKVSYGAGRVGLLTGDNSINGSAPVVVMTTEVLRNMIYAESRDLESLRVVILDEVHYLQDRARGGVWEEVIIHLPKGIQLVCLSATVANPSDFTDWVTSRRGPTRLIVESTRPVPLETWYLASDRSGPDGILYEPMFVGGRPNERLNKLLRVGRNLRSRFAPPRRIGVVEHLASIDRLPAIYFVFSRRGCESAADSVAAQVTLTTREEADEIEAIFADRTRHLSSQDLQILGYEGFVDRLRRGVATHHAGLVPAFKEAVEEVFVRGLAKVVFATETLALGINMPARTVVIESLSKYTGDGHELLQPGDFTQLTGRAGRRGIDTAGTAVVLHSSWVPFSRMVGIAAAGTHPLRSSFRPTYNMAANLVSSYSRSEAEALVEASFGQFAGQQKRAQLEHQAAELLDELGLARTNATCELGDVTPYIDGGRAAPVATMLRSFAQELEPGDIVEGGLGRWVVLAKGTGSNPRLLMLTTSGEAKRLRPSDLGSDVVRVGSMALPEPFAPRLVEFRDKVSRSLRRWDSPNPPTLSAVPESSDPVLACPELDHHIESARAQRRLEREVVRMSSRLERHRSDLITSFRAVLELLRDHGYVSDWSLTPKGESLRSIYSELDLRIIQALEDGLFEGLDFAELAAFASVFVYEPRLADFERPLRQLNQRVQRVGDIDRVLARAERRLGLGTQRPPSDGFAGTIFAWARGDDLDEVLGPDEAPGDLVRNSRQVIDLLRQLGEAFAELRPAAREAITAIDRGIVAAGGIE